MGSRTVRRLVLYSIGVLVLAGLGYFGFVYEADPDYGTIVSSARMCAEFGEPDDGLAWAEKALAIEPDDRYVHLIVARCYQRKKEWDRALASYQRAWELTPVDDPNRETILLYRAEVLESAGRADEAIREVEAVTERSPEALSAWYLLGRLHEAAERFGAAKQAYSSAREQAPEDFEPVALLAFLAERQGDRAAARSLLTEALALVAALRGNAPGNQPMPASSEPEPAVVEQYMLQRKHAEIELGLAKLLVADGDVDAAEDHLVAAAAIDRRLTLRHVRTEELLAPFRGSERLRAVLTGSTPAGGEKN